MVGRLAYWKRFRLWSGICYPLGILRGDCMIQNRKSGKILVIGDNVKIRAGISGIIDKAGPGFTITEADSGFDAMAKLRNEVFGLVIIDLYMSKKCGVELIDEVRSSTTINMPIIAIFGDKTIKNYSIPSSDKRKNFIPAQQAHRKLIDLVKFKLETVKN